MGMIIPIDLLIENQGNMYTLTCAAIKRSIQINIAGDDELEENMDKVQWLELLLHGNNQSTYQIGPWMSS